MGEEPGAPQDAKLAQDGPLCEFVADKLAERWSPEQICNALVIEFPDDGSMRVSPETIYQAIYVQTRGGLRREVALALRTGRTRRKAHRSPEQRTRRFTDEMVMISERPAEVEDRAVPGHWEATSSATRRHVTERRWKDSADALSQQRNEAGGRLIRETPVRLASSPDNDESASPEPQPVAAARVGSRERRVRGAAASGVVVKRPRTDCADAGSGLWRP